MSKKNLEGMRYPSVDSLLNVVDSKYKLAYLAAHRAKLIAEEDNETLVDTKCKKNVGRALEEVLAEKFEVEFSISDEIEQNFK